MLASNDGWPARIPSTRQRKPARPKPADTRKTVKPTPRGKYGLAPREERPLQQGDGEPATSSSPSTGTSHVEFYQQLVAGTWPGLPSNQQRQQRRLFAADANTDVANHTASGAAGVCRKLHPALRTTQRWTRLQRKLLPKYLMALDDQTSVLLLKCLVRLQPPVALMYPEQQTAATNSSDLTSQPGVAVSDAWQPQPPRRAQLTAAAFPTSINGAIRHRCYVATSAPDTGESGDAAAADVAAAARGFASAADERAEFNLMLAGVCAALQQKLVAWDGRRLVEALCCLAQLHNCDDGFLQAWCVATQPHLHRLPMSYLASCCEALASLAALVPSNWLQAFTVATAGRLGQLSLQQLALLLMHVGDLQLQLPDSWWQEYCCCVLRRAAKQLDPGKLGMQLGQPAAAGQEPQGVAQQPQEQPQQLQEPQASRLRAAADALCSMLWACSQLAGQPLQQQWLARVLALLLPAVVAQQCSPGAAVQLLHACCVGAGRELPAAGSSMQACLACVQQRPHKVCADANTLQLLLGCMQLPRMQQVLPPSFCADLEAALVPALPSLPAQVLVELAAVFGATEHRPGMEFLSSFVVVTRHKLGSMGPAQIVLLVDGCQHMRGCMPSLWVVAVLQQLQQCVAARPDVVGRHSRSDAAAVATVGRVSAADVEKALQQLEQVAADWSGACLASCGAVDVLQDCVCARV